MTLHTKARFFIRFNKSVLFRIYDTTSVIIAFLLNSNEFVGYSEKRLNTPTQHPKINLRESFLTPREVKIDTISSDDDEDDSDSKNTFAAFKNDSSFSKSKVHNSDIIDVSSSDEEEVSCVMSLLNR